MITNQKNNAMENTENIISIMEKYNLTLRRLPKVRVHEFAYHEGYQLKEGDSIVERVVMKMSAEKFSDRRERGLTGSWIWRSGYVIEKRVLRKEKREGGWAVKLDSTTNSIQQWNRSTDFFGNTPEEAVGSALESIRKSQIHTLLQETEASVAKYDGDTDPEIVAELSMFAKNDSTYYDDNIKPIIEKARDRELSEYDLFELVLETIDTARALYLITSGQMRELTTAEKEHVAAELSLCVMEELEC